MMIPERLKAKPRKTSSRKPSKLDQIHRSQKRILAAFAKQTAEIGILRRYVLEMREKEMTVIETGIGLTDPWDFSGSGRYCPVDSIDSPQPK